MESIHKSGVSVLYTENVINLFICRYCCCCSWRNR